MITVTGKTFDHRDMLLSMRGVWNSADRNWEFRHLSEANKERLRKTPGLFVIEVGETETDDDDWISDIIETVLGGDKEPAKPRKVHDQPSRLFGDDQTYYNCFADQNPRAFFGFSSLGACIDYIDSLPQSVRIDSQRSGWEGQAKWSGSRDMAEAMKIARHGWQEGVEQAEAMTERLGLDNPRVRRRSPAYAGGAVNVGRMLSGDPRHMVSRPKQPGRKVITLFVEAGCSSFIKPETMTIRAALIGALIDTIENAGYSCTLVSIWTSVNGTKPIFQMTTTLKEAGERLNLSDLMFSLGHPSFLRRFGFAVYTSVDETRSAWGGLGTPSDSFDKFHMCGPNEFYIPVFTQQNKLTDDPLSILGYIVPDGLPVDVKGI